MARQARNSAARQTLEARPARLPAGWQEPKHNLPAALNSFIGRGHELAAARRAADAGRLVTLVGPGGVGKSRLGLELARERLAQHPDGVWRIDLAALADGSLLTRAVASALEINEGPRRSLEAALVQVVRERDLLLFFDNCEHVVTACAQLVERLLEGCPRLRVLATSREPLRITGEQLLEVAPLVIPAAGERDARRLRVNEAVWLFAERARAVRADFALTDEVGEAVAEVCRRLDGLPLALELAAARLRTLSVDELARGLDERFGLLTGGRRTAPPRERTLRGMVDWSWELLGEPERRLLRRLAVFAGGWTRAAAEAVCAGESLAACEVNPLLSALVERSLVLREGWRNGTRYRLLDTLRAYAWERLEAAGEATILRRRHQAWYLARLAMSFSEMDADQFGWLAWMDTELDNVRLALDWCRAEPSTAEQALCSSPGLWGYWDLRGHFDESRRLFAELLSLLPPGPPSPGHVLGQVFYAHVVASQGDFAQAVPMFEEIAALPAQMQDPVAAYWRGLMELQWRMFFDIPSAPGFARSLLAAHRSRPLPLGEALLRWYLGAALLATGELDQADDTFRKAAESTRAEFVRAHVADGRGRVAYRRGDLAAAEGFFHEALADLAKLRTVRGCGVAVEHLASVAGRSGAWERTARLLGAAEMIYELGSTIPIAPWQLDPEEIPAGCRDALGEKAFAVALATGRSMSFERAVQFALEPDRSPERARRGQDQSRLTRREMEIAGLVAQGLTNRRIAEALVLSEKTVETHLSHILAKLSLSSRTRLAIWAAEHDIHQTAGERL